MTIRQLLYLYRNKIKDWDSDECGYFIYLKKPYAINEGLYYTDMISEDTVEDVARKMKLVEKIDPVVWDKI